MRIKFIVAGAAIALAAGVGTTSAAEQFSMLEGVVADPMSASQMEGARAATGSIGANPTFGSSDAASSPGAVPTTDQVNFDIALSVPRDEIIFGVTPPPGFTVLLAGVKIGF